MVVTQLGNSGGISVPSKTSNGVYMRNSTDTGDENKKITEDNIDAEGGIISGQTAGTLDEWADKYIFFDDSATALRKKSADSLKVTLTADSAAKTSDTTVSNVSGFLLPVEANTRYDFRMYIHGQGPASADMDIAIAVPTGTTFGEMWRVSESNDTSVAIGSELTIDTGAVGNERGTMIVGFVTIGGTAGNLQIQMAQNVSNATATKICEGSSFVVERG